MNKKIQQKRVAIYARVSTLDKGQNPETQLTQLREYAESRGFEVEHELVDYASGRNDDRINYKQLFDLARKRKLDVVLVWRYDRFARSTQALVNALVEFRDLGVDFISYQENIDTTTPQVLRCTPTDTVRCKVPDMKAAPLRSVPSAPLWKTGTERTRRESEVRLKRK